jgi:thioredoxin 1
MSVVKITMDNFSEEIEKSEKTVLLDFWAEWCGPCRMMSPIIDQIAEEVGEKAKVGKVNVEEESYLASQFKITNIPTLLIIKNGRIINKYVGVQDKETLINELI